MELNYKLIKIIQKQNKIQASSILTSLLLNILTSATSLRSLGRLFQHAAPLKANDRCPVVNRHLTKHVTKFPPQF